MRSRQGVEGAEGHWGRHHWTEMVEERKEVWQSPEGQV